MKSIYLFAIVFGAALGIFITYFAYAMNKPTSFQTVSPVVVSESTSIKVTTVRAESAHYEVAPETAAALAKVGYSADTLVPVQISVKQ